jgi:hypothetical protein
VGFQDGVFRFETRKTLFLLVFLRFFGWPDPCLKNRMTFADIFSAAVKLRRVIAVISIIAGVGCKYGPAAWHKFSPKPAVVAVATVKNIAPTISTNIPAPLAPNDVGEVTLTNHYETCVHLGRGKDCLVTPRLIDSRTVELTLTLETHAPGGKIHDLTVTQVNAKPGKPLEVAMGGFQFSMTPLLASE